MPTSAYSGTTSGSPTVTTSGSDTIMLFNASELHSVMAHFAKLGVGNIVERVVVVSNDIATTEQAGMDF